MSTERVLLGQTNGFGLRTEVNGFRIPRIAEFRDSVAVIFFYSKYSVFFVGLTSSVTIPLNLFI